MGDVIIVQPVNQPIVSVVGSGTVYAQGGGGNGSSAYEIAVLNGYIGTEQQWLASLVGPQGYVGSASTIPGPQGPKGEMGPINPDTTQRVKVYSFITDIFKGMVVYHSGATSSSPTDGIEVSPYFGSASLPQAIVGIAETDILIGQTGYVVTKGMISGIDTSAAITPSMPIIAATDMVFGWALFDYDRPKPWIYLGRTVRNATDGAIFVDIERSAANTLSYMADVDFTTTPMDGQVLAWDGNYSSWKPSTKVGEVGPQGPIGFVGSRGADGAVGPQGPIGFVGSKGTDGAVGPQGPIGYVGSRGADGAALIDDAATTSTTVTWSANKINTTLGDISSALTAIIG